MLFLITENSHLIVIYISCNVMEASGWGLRLRMRVFQYHFVIWITKHKQWINRVRRKTCFSAGIASGSMWQSLPNERITCDVLIMFNLPASSDDFSLPLFLVGGHLRSSRLFALLKMELYMNLN